MILFFMDSPRIRWWTANVGWMGGDGAGQGFRYYIYIIAFRWEGIIMIRWMRALIPVS
jgi:hypothetical protein